VLVTVADLLVIPAQIMPSSFGIELSTGMNVAVVEGKIASVLIE
jgi:hypothetical protein